MGHWSILSSTDYMDDTCDYEVAAPVEDALARAQEALAHDGRVLVEPLDAGGLLVTTVKHTPGWAFVPVLLPFVRVKRSATVTARASASGSGALLEVRGRLDTAAANRLRALRVA